jgi:hypothetical protein
MKESALFSSLLPSYPDLHPILQNIRDKYGIPEIDPDDIGMKEIHLSGNEIDWQSVHQEIETQIYTFSECLGFHNRNNIIKEIIPIRKIRPVTERNCKKQPISGSGQ